MRGVRVNSRYMGTVDEQIFMGSDGVSRGPLGGDAPSQEQIAKAIAGSKSTGKVMKVLYLDDAGESVGEWASSQVPENPFDGQMQGLQMPPFRLEQLLYLAESHPVHSAALEQKTADITGQGWSWDPIDEDAADEDQRDLLAEWFEGLSPDDVDTHEIIHSAWLDVETVGWGTIEVARDPSDKVQRLYHVPAHTVRAHRDGFRLCQIRDARKVWFRRWGCPDVNGQRVVVDAKSGSKTTIRVPANDLFVIKRPARRSTWYGIPGYISSVGYITLALAARDDNLFWFANRREPRWAIVLSNLSDDPNLEEDLRRAFVVDMKQPYRNLMIPIQGPGKVEFNKLSDTKTDGSFAVLAERADKAIMIAHRVPGERLANSQVGPLGGNATQAASRIYKDGVVAPAQELINKRFNRFIKVEWPKADGGSEPQWKLHMDDLDIDDDRQDLDMTVIAFHGNLINLGEARAKIGLGPLMKKVKPDPIPDPNATAPMIPDPTDVAPVDPETQKPDPTHVPRQIADPMWVAPMIQPDAPSPGVDEDGVEIPVPEEESQYNDMIFTELPGAAGVVANPAAPPSGSGGLKTSRELEEMGDGIRSLLWDASETQKRLIDLADRPLPEYPEQP